MQQQQQRLERVSISTAHASLKQQQQQIGSAAD